MKRLYLVSLIVVLAGLISACNFFTQPGDLQTENLQAEVARTQIAAVRATATVNADSLMVTLSGVQTAVSSVDEQSTRIASTLIANGMSVVDTSGIVVPTNTPAPADQSGSSPAPQIANPLLTPGAPVVSDTGGARGDTQLVPVTSAAQLQVTADPNQPSLTDLTLTGKVGADDCPVQPATTFTTADTDIYITAVAHNLAKGTPVSSTWTSGGQQAAHYDWSPTFNIKSACIWFHLPANEVPFTPGSWSVAVTLDGQPVGAPIQFTITGTAPSQIAVTPQVGG